MPHGRLVTGAECECLARMCLARPLARNEGLGRGGCPALIPPHTSLTHTSVCTVLHLVVFGESTLVSTMWPQRRCVQRSMQSPDRNAARG